MRNTTLYKNLTNNERDIVEIELARIGVSLPDNLLDRFDDVITKRGYSSRSEGIRDAIRSYILNYEWMSEVEGERVGIVSVVYDHDQRGLMNTLMDIQHNYSGVIQTSIHVHLNDDNCLEIIVLRGDSTNIKGFADKVTALKGVKHVKLNTITPGSEL
jgi:CopG family nickel-responsive transcriptional regulator